MMRPANCFLIAAVLLAICVMPAMARSIGEKVNWQDPASWDTQQITAVATAAYALFSILLWLAILSQTKATKRAANAAKRSADTLAQSERPYLAVGSESTRISDAWHDRQNRSVSFLIHNFGRIPGRLSWWTIRARVHPDLDLPGDPEYPDPHRLYGVVVPNGAVEVWASGDMGLTEEDDRRYAEHGHHLFFYGFVEYQSLDRTVSYGPPVQFCFRYARNEPEVTRRFVIAGGRSYWEGKPPHRPHDNGAPSGAPVTFTGIPPSTTSVSALAGGIVRRPPPPEQR